MKTLQIEVPDRLAEEIERLVQAGWFANEAEVARLAIADFVRRYPFELQERFQREDIRGPRASRTLTVEGDVCNTGPLLHLWSCIGIATLPGPPP